MKRLDAINELLEDVSLKIKEIRSVYRNSETNEDIGKINNPIVKNCLENLRSVLDYSACEIYEYVNQVNIEKTRKKIYFPYASSKTKFKEIINRSPFVNLKCKNESLFNLLLSIQPFETHNTCIIDLCQITNYYKHNNSKKQERINSGKITTDIKFEKMKGSFVRIGDTSSVYIENCLFSDGKNTEIIEKLDLRGNTPIKELNNVLNKKLIAQRNFEKVNFNIDGIDILYLIETAYKGVEEYIKKLFNTIK